jgi:hypothetical protein
MSSSGAISIHMMETLQSLMPLAGALTGNTVAQGEIDLAKGDNLLLEKEVLMIAKELFADKLATDDVSFLNSSQSRVYFN